MTLPKKNKRVKIKMPKAMLRIEYGYYPNTRVVSVPLGICTDIKLVVLNNRPIRRKP